MIREKAPFDAHVVPLAHGDLHRVTLPSSAVEALVDALRSRYGEIRITLLPVEATLPRATEEPAETPAAEPVRKDRNRVSREELIEDIHTRLAVDGPFIVTVAVSSLVACIGLIRGDLVAIIAAMVIAPLLGPNVGLALAATLADGTLLRRSLRSGLVGIGLSLLIAIAIGALVGAEPSAPEIQTRTTPGLPEVLLALASGVAGGLAFTTGLPASLIGVMVAVALLPPLATGGLLLGAGHLRDSTGAFVLLGINLIAVNLAGVATFLAQGIQPLFWSEAERARRAARRALLLWSVLLLALILSLLWIEGETPW